MTTWEQGITSPESVGVCVYQQCSANKYAGLALTQFYSNDFTPARGSRRFRMIKDEIENTPSTDGQVHVVVQFVLHVSFV
jgi:hypothetical protein